MMPGKRTPTRRAGGGRRLDPEAMERLVDAVLRGGPDRGRYLARGAGSEAEAEVARLVAALREVGAARAPVSDSQVEAIMDALKAESSTGSWLARRSPEIELVATGIGSGATLWYGLTQLHSIVFSVPANRGAVLLVAACGALVCLLLHRASAARGQQEWLLESE